MNRKETIPIPIYYMIAKSASSSIMTNLRESFGTNWSQTVHKNHAIPFIGHSVRIHTDCGFTFVRNPITRFIAGYYTINRKIYNLHHSLSNTSLFAEEKWNRNWLFLRKFQEPDRFITFVEEMVSNPYHFSLLEPMSHINSMTAKSFSVYFGSDLHFIGKVEYMDSHWNALMEQCQWFGDHLVSQDMSYAMTGWGNSNFAGEYADILDLKRNRTLSPAYYIVAVCEWCQPIKYFVFVNESNVLFFANQSNIF